MTWITLEQPLRGRELEECADESESRKRLSDARREQQAQQEATQRRRLDFIDAYTEAVTLFGLDKPPSLREIESPRPRTLVYSRSAAEALNLPLPHTPLMEKKVGNS